MNQEIKKIIARFKRLNDSQPWFGKSINSSLESYRLPLLSDTSLYVKSIIEIAAHMYQWRMFVIKKLEEEEDFDIELDSVKDWPDTSDLSWEDIKSNLSVSSDELIECLQGKDDAFLDSIVPGKRYNFRFLIEGIMQHDIYHLGQMNLIHSSLSSSTFN